MNDLHVNYKTMIAEGIIPPFRGKSGCSDFGIFATYLIAYGVDKRFSKEKVISSIKEYIEYLKHWCKGDKGAEQEIETLQEKIKATH